MSFRRGFLPSFSGALIGLYLGAFIASNGSPGHALTAAARSLAQACAECPIPLDAADPRFSVAAVTP